MSEKEKKKNQPVTESPQATEAEEEMDLEEAAEVAKVLAKLIIAAEGIEKANSDKTNEDDSEDSVSVEPSPHIITEEELLAAEAAEIAEKKTFHGKLSNVLNRVISVLSPDNKKLALPAFIFEVLVLIAFIVILGRYSHVAPETPTQYADTQTKDKVSCTDGKLIFNNVTALVPSEGNVSYNISYSWAEDDVEYPSIPQAIIATYADDEGNTSFDISLYRDSFTPKEEIPEGKTYINWFSDWKSEQSENILKFPHRVGEIRGFCISNLDSRSVSTDYRTITYYFTIPEKQGISVYTLEGVCYDPESIGSFKEIITDSINSLRSSENV